MNQWSGVIARVERLLQRLDGLLDSHAPDTDQEVPFAGQIAFRWERLGRSGHLLPVEHPHLFNHADLVGIDDARDDLVRNTAQFVAGFPANNVLLWGERGTGKSSCVKGLLPLFAGQGLRLVEVQKQDLMSLPQIVRQLRPVPYRFILFCDDLSFDEGETSYRELKAILEGGIEERPDNVLLYATSNRRHLMPEPMGDNLGQEIHPEEAISEKLSLADRFGLTLSFCRFDQATYLEIVDHYACQLGLQLDSEELHRGAIRWALRRGQRSGRTARQYIDDLAGRLALEQKSQQPAKG